MTKTFILGIGAQRTGSTWLHAQLRKNRSINMGLCKEYHVFDVLFTPYLPNYRRGLTEKINRGREAGEQVARELKLRSFLEDPGNYFNYFHDLYERNAQTQAVGDFTPSYSMLDADAFRFIRSGLNERGFRVRVIFMMRDPVERVWSMFHQAAKVRKALESNQKRVATLVTFTNPEASMRTRYDRTIAELEKVFPPDDIFYDFYERFFTPGSYSNLGRFLDMELENPDFATVRNKSLEKSEVPPDLAKQAARHYAQTYRFIRHRFGEQMVDLWPGYRDPPRQSPPAVPGSVAGIRTGRRLHPDTSRSAFCSRGRRPRKFSDSPRRTACALARRNTTPPAGRSFVGLA
ncbi:sulfotransferase domain-containing protein [Elongatibacter sediminis]|uniref:Sulfotransferase domain-containing protein n=1 Tax=Elongatibacter sediminis TaxID=3119006 RepID=A0AAW9RCH9_9GAMM